MIKSAKVERLIHAVGGPKQAEIILANTPKSAFFYQPKLGLYVRKSVVANGLLTTVLLGGKWVIWGNPNELIKLSDLRQALVVFQKANMLDHACNDSQIDLALLHALQKFTMGDYVVCLDLTDTDDLFKIIEMHKHPVNGISYVLTNGMGLKIKLQEGLIRKAMSQEKLIGRRINNIDEALTVSEVEYIRGLGHA